MPVEIEAKLSVPDLAAVRTKLQSVGAESKGEALETNTFFDTEDRSLLAADQGLRLRKKLKQDSKEVTYTITYKGPRKHGQFKSREETELNVASDRDAINLFSKLGYLRVLSFEKRRESWEIDGCSVELDELPHLGTFVEIEGPSEEAVKKVQHKLDLGDRPMVKTSYIALLMTHLQSQGDSSRTVTFENVGEARDER